MYIYKYIVHQHWGLKKTHEMEMGTKWGKTPTAETIFQETLGENWLGDDQADLWVRAGDELTHSVTTNLHWFDSLILEIDQKY